MGYIHEGSSGSEHILTTTNKVVLYLLQLFDPGKVIPYRRTSWSHLNMHRYEYKQKPLSISLYVLNNEQQLVIILMCKFRAG